MSDLINRQDAIKAVANYLWHYPNEQYKNLNVFEIAESLAKDALSVVPSEDRPTGKWISEELANMICNEICYYKEVTVDADSLNDLCEGCLIKKKKYGRPTGEWIRNDNGTYSCCVCQSWIPKEQHGYARYCLYCGAKMKGGTE